jgi:4-hydroxy-2-oxoheptanedioate aldolase
VSGAVPSSFRKRLQDGERVLGTFINLGSSLTAEIMAISGYDWVVLDLEHGAGDESIVVSQLQAIGRTGTAGIVRVESLELPRFMHALDAGADGVLVPRLTGAADAQTAVENTRYASRRGLAKSNRCWHWGIGARTLDEVDGEVVVAAQIETASALAEAEDIAAIDGVDILFVGPTDLAHSLELHCPPDDPRLIERVQPVVEAARKHGKACGVMTGQPKQLKAYADLGFTFLGGSSDGGLLALAARAAIGEMREL